MTYIGQPTIGHEQPFSTHKDYLFEGVLPERGLAFVFGEPKVGKSLFMIWLSACLATGKPLFHLSDSQRERLGEGFSEPSNKGAVLYLTAEDAIIFPKRSEAALLHLQSSNGAISDGLFYGKLPIIRLPVSSLSGSDNKLAVAEAIEVQRAALDQEGLPIRLIVFDTLTAAFIISDENDNSKMQALMRCLRDYGQHFDCLVLAVAHPNKNGRGKIRGAGSIEASADTMLEITKARGKGKANRRILKISDLRDGSSAGERFDFEISECNKTGVIYPVARNDQSTPIKQKSQGQLTRYQIDLLLIMESLSQTNGEIVENCIGQLVYGISLEQMVQFQVENSPQPLAGEDTKKIKDRIRKQVGRGGLHKLVEIGIIEKYEVSGRPYFRPAIDWDTTTFIVTDIVPGMLYKSECTQKFENIQEAFSPPECNAMSRSTFHQFGQNALKLERAGLFKNSV